MTSPRRTLGAPSALALLAMCGCSMLDFHRGPMPGEPDAATYATVNGVRLRYELRGDGPAVVLVHGFASAIESWSTVTPALALRHKVLALDLMGFGWSERPEDGDYSPAGQARLVLALMDQLGIERASVVAHSFGASIALAMALEAPARVDRLALYSAWALDEQLPSFFVWSRVPGLGETLHALFYDQRPDDRTLAGFYDERFVGQALIDDIERAMRRPGTRAAALASARAMRFTDQATRYHEVRVPVLLLWGREDRVSRLEVGERLLHELPAASLRAYARCGHFPMIEAAAESTRDLVHFVEGGS